MANTTFIDRATNIQASWLNDVNIFVYKQGRAYFNVKGYGATGNGTTDDTSAIQAAINAASLAGQSGATLFFPRGLYKVTSTLQVNTRGLFFQGEWGQRGDTTNKGSEISWYGTTGAVIQIGIDDGQPWDTPLYNGYQGTTFDNIAIVNRSASRVAALNAGGTYSANTYAIRDWRGGDITINKVDIEGFEYNFWGINSDFNTFKNITSLYSKFGIYAGPRSDQFSIYDLYSFNCDHVVTIDGAAGIRLINPNIVICGSTIDYPILIRRGSGIVTIDNPWLENFSGITNQIAFVGAGVEDGYGGNTNFTLGTIINNPYIATGIGSPGSVKYLVVLGNARGVIVTNPVAAAGISLTTNLTKIAAFASGINHTTSNSTFSLHSSGAFVTKLFDNLGTGTPAIYYESDDNAKKIGNNNGRFSILTPGAVAGVEELRISNEGGAGQVVINAPTYAGGQTNRYVLRRSVQEINAMPLTGTWEQGDFVRNTAPSVLGTAGNRYVIFGWLRLITGNTHVLNTDWTEVRTLTGT